MTKVGIIHVHSKFSYDGKNTLEELASFAKERRYAFVGVTEHSDFITEQIMTSLVKECRRLSDDQCLLIPGIEFTCKENLHILGVGVEHLTDVDDPIAVAKFIGVQGGVAIVSHPSRYDYHIPTGLEAHLNGIEIWNASYDGRFVPNDQSIKLWQALRSQNRALLGFGGQDLHQIKPYGHVKITVFCDALEEGAILQALKEGAFSISSSYCRLARSSPPRWIKLQQIIWARRAYIRAKAIKHRFLG
jgi:predicted metal-dependent phosphoesterase TrpH